MRPPQPSTDFFCELLRFAVIELCSIGLADQISSGASQGFLH